ncbi:transcription repressor NadR [Kurthia sibirica]|uniref:Transcription repressor NadR n=1 Tax=Kurthia sibirica TaxID=202750 RepID=A0A2U3AIF7_9BACL|nr:transcription repressor NadR [Kurthia sibirica]PWI24333.1 transcription repressor NadR [Kurthia sibirica]GEK34381.1 transcriptional regulator [Kurthia sibirica]
MKKLLGDERRNYILELLRQEGKAITGTELAKRSNVSRQVIVNDMALLKAKNEPIIATSQGYLYLSSNADTTIFEREIASYHTTAQAEDELNILVDAGVTVKNVTIVHPVYGYLTASIMVSSRYDVQQFIQKIKETDSNFLMDLTEGAHLHVISADSEEKLDQAVEQLSKKGYLLSINE